MPMCSEWEDGLLKIKGIGPYLCREFDIIIYALVVLPQKHKTNTIWYLKKPRKNMRIMNFSKQMVYYLKWMYIQGEKCSYWC